MTFAYGPSVRPGRFETYDFGRVKKSGKVDGFGNLCVLRSPRGDNADRVGNPSAGRY